MIHNAVAEHNLIPHTADDRGVTPGYQRNWTRAHDLNTAALLSFSARERCRLETSPERLFVVAGIRVVSGFVARSRPHCRKRVELWCTSGGCVHLSGIPL